MKSTEIRKLLELPVKERMELAQILWDSVEPSDEAHFLSIPDWQRSVLAERSAELEGDPANEEPWEDVKAELWRRP
jgi:putative addiction module component (TIGR02574 family)